MPTAEPAPLRPTVLLPAEVAWYATGRFYADAAGAIQDVGYFLHLPDLDDEALFDGAPGEGTACFTFASAPFTASKLANGALSLAVDVVGEFGIYFNRQPAGTFDDPRSFAAGEEIARFRRRSIVVGATLGQDGTRCHPSEATAALLAWAPVSPIPRALAPSLRGHSPGSA